MAVAINLSLFELGDLSCQTRLGASLGQVQGAAQGRVLQGLGGIWRQLQLINDHRVLSRAMISGLMNASMMR
jgi:hypothetical protein